MELLFLVPISDRICQMSEEKGLEEFMKFELLVEDALTFDF